jgi:hypothetical protein
MAPSAVFRGAATKSRRSAHGPAALSRSRATARVGRRSSVVASAVSRAAQRVLGLSQYGGLGRYVSMSWRATCSADACSIFPYPVASAELPMTSRQILHLALTSLLSRRGPRHSLTLAGSQPYPCIHDVRWLRQPGDGVPP